MITHGAFAQRLAFQQLKGTAAVDKHNLGVICPKHEGMILSLANQGLVDLCTRFPLIKKQIDLTFVADQNLYWLDSTMVGTYLTEVDDVLEPNGFIKVLDVFDADGDTHPHDTNGHIMTPVFNKLRFTTDKMTELGEKVRISYQSLHVPMVNDDSEIDIPPNMETALQLFVASLFISHMNGKEHSAKGDSYFAAYLRHIGEDELRDTSSTSEIEEDNRFSERGFV